MSTEDRSPGNGVARAGREPAGRVLIFDTTLRDGEQSPGISLNRQEKLEIAHQLARLGVDVIEAGFPMTSPGDVEFSPEDGSRSDVPYMAEVIQIALEEGATTINVPDTVGYTMPREYAAMFEELYRLVPALGEVTVSVHCHDDLGLAVANSLAGVEAGCRQVECAINGIGERAGNASLEEVAMLLRTREPSLGLWTGIDTTEIARTSRLVSRLTGYQVQANKEIVGRNASAHEAGIHKDGMVTERRTYEIMYATSLGLRRNSIVLGKHSGRHALRKAQQEMGYELDGQVLNTAFKRFKEI